ncbi:hypothetical protein VOLCADRAFT_115610 [Volvox carteri f. nagariensis]|uniref:Uncharacterized protein n=1 Tax=Volvox carteri f. nagariensis TaxID=3068 RepID=D8TH67_VOLCA|nr:uncharacterized protein VOLCADRAFT_115610 [Volvox carteri f. nagariensis]EFJ53017.1 hypothetical protein VOLCADRAFT_115610 [Volvox carteri f. nagariensis]|eukprot:XP_002946022.1 hypothetical protein VOLCADRAFT_115610 [Volvox carteri f. nagariensis]
MRSRSVKTQLQHLQLTRPWTFLGLPLQPESASTHPLRRLPGNLWASTLATSFCGNFNNEYQLRSIRTAQHATRSFSGIIATRRGWAAQHIARHAKRQRQRSTSTSITTTTTTTTNRITTLDDASLTDEAARRLLLEEEERRRRRKKSQGRLKELEEIRMELAEKELALLEKEKALLAKEQTLAVLTEELEVERKLRALLTKEKERAEEEGALAMGLCMGGFSLP